MRVFAVLTMIAGLVVSAAAADFPIGARTLKIRAKASGATLTFVSRDANAPFPAIGSADDPATGTLGGVVVELFSSNNGSGSMNVPPGLGKPGWQAKLATISQYKFTNSAAPAAPSPVKTLSIRQGKQLKIVAKDVPVPLQNAHGTLAIRVTMGTLRACAFFGPQTITKDVPGSFIGKNAVVTALPDCDDETLGNPPNQCGGLDTFTVIQQRIFTTKGCDVGTCHGPFAAASLDLRPGASYAELVGVSPSNPAANAAGKKLVDPFDAVGSFLSQKLHGTMDGQGGEGAAMPLVGAPLSTDELAVIDAWIDAGAPETGEVAGAPCLPPPTYEPAPALDPPPGGHQLILNGPVLQPGVEQEGCLWVPVPNSTDFDVSKWEFSLNPGTHHFAVFEWNRSGAPTTNVWTANDFGCFSGTQFGNNLSGSPQAPYFVDAYPSGVARRIYAGRYLGLNAHYRNVFNVPIQIKVYINMYPYSGSPPRLATTIVDVDDTLSINIPPFTQAIHPAGSSAYWVNDGSLPRNVMFLGGHMHNRGLRFTVWASNGTKLYESFDWAHPNARHFDPPLVLAPGDWLDYECLYDNGVTRPVRTNGSGNPTNLVFGVTTEDAMCIVTGTYYE
jgi:hypothetical protein